MIKVYFNTDPATIKIPRAHSLWFARDDHTFMFIAPNQYYIPMTWLMNYTRNHEYKNPTRVRSSGAAARSKTHRKV